MKKITLFLILLMGLSTINCSVMGWFFPSIKIWVAEADGKAKLDSAKLLGDAEVERAKGVAQANKIIGDSLKGNDAYLRYLWINEISNQPNAMYIATEGGLPILTHNTNPR